LLFQTLFALSLHFLVDTALDMCIDEAVTQKLKTKNKLSGADESGGVTV